MILADSIGQVNGYDDSELFDTLNSGMISDYTVEQEGLEITENGDFYSVKMDINKKVPLVDLTDFYLEPDEFDFVKEIVENESTGNQTGKKLKMTYNLIVGDDENYIYIGEKDEATQSTYNSILSALKVMYNDSVAEYFESIYPEISEVGYVTDGFEIDVDAYVDVEEHPLFDGYVVTMVKVDNDFVKEEILRTEYIGETVDHGAKTLSLDFTKNSSFKLGFFDSVKSSDAGFLYKYVLEPLFIESEAELVDNTAYFDIVDGKITVGDKENSVFKLVIEDDGLRIAPTLESLERTTVTGNYENAVAKEYEEGKSQDHFRYGTYNVTLNVTYGPEYKNYEVLEGNKQKVNVLKNEELKFRFDIDYSEFLSSGEVYVDDKLVDASNYTTKEGSTIITFKSDFTNNLSAGNHTLKVATLLGEANTTFKVTNTTNNPATGDNIMIFAILLTMSFATVIFVITKKNVRV